MQELKLEAEGMVFIMRSAIVGCGGIAQVHAKVLDALPEAALCGFADIKKERADRMAEQYGGRAYENLEEMLEKEQPEVLHICTPHYLHVPMAELALEKGIHVLMEKPPAISAEQLADIKKITALNSSVQLGICFQNRYNKNTVKALRLMREGKTGAVLGARAFVTWKRGEKYYTESGWRGSLATEGGGVLINQAIHTLDLLGYFLGDPVSVEANICNHHLKGIIEVEDTAEAYIRFKNQNASFYATTAYCTDAPVFIELVCENMTLQLEANELVCRYPNGEKESIRFQKEDFLGKDYWGEGHMALVKDFYQCLLSGRHFAIDIDEASRALNLMLGIYRSSETKTAVALKK